MTPDEFLTLGRFPTAAEFVAFVEGQGWTFRRLPGGGPAVRGPGLKENPVALLTARLLSREPYRTNVLAVLMSRWREAGEVGIPKPPPHGPAPAAAPQPTGRVWLWRDGHTFASTPEVPALAHPVGAWWYRDTAGPWRPVPGRSPACATQCEMWKWCDGCKRAFREGAAYVLVAGDSQVPPGEEADQGALQPVAGVLPGPRGGRRPPQAEPVDLAGQGDGQGHDRLLGRLPEGDGPLFGGAEDE